MSKRIKMIVRFILLICFLAAALGAVPVSHALAGSFSGALPGLQAEQINSTAQMRTALDLIGSCFTEARDRGQLTFDLQKLIIAKLGECISRLSEMLQEADTAAGSRQEELRSLFKQSRVTLTAVHDYNQKKVERLAEDKLDGVKDQAAFFASPQWQEPQYLVSLASYWLSWNGYYGALLYPAGDEHRTELLNVAAAGFARTFLDFREQTIIVRSLFGRSLCYRELGRYDRALQDLNSAAAKIGTSDPLYARLQYEKVRLSLMTGNQESALNQIKEAWEDTPAEKMPQQMREGLMQLQAGIILSRLEKRLAQQNLSQPEYYREALQELSRAAGSDEAVAAELYRFVLNHAAAIEKLSAAQQKGDFEAELGGIGSLAIADWLMKEKRYGDALARYRRLYAAPDRLVKKRMDEVSFNLGWCLSQREQWQEAASVLESFFATYSGSQLGSRAACLYYGAATNAYRREPGQLSYNRYIAAAQIYLRRCTEAKERSEVHYQLGKYYEKSNKPVEALREFAQVGADSLNFVEARYNVIRSNLEKLEAAVHQVEDGEVHKLQHETLGLLEDMRPAITKIKDEAGRHELEAQMTLLQVRAYASSSDDAALRKSLQLLEHFEKRFVGCRQQQLLRSGVQTVRIQCLLKLGKALEAETEISNYIRDGADNATGWGLLYGLADMLHDQSRKLRDAGNTPGADSRAGMAITLYSRLAPMAERMPAHVKDRDRIRLRQAQMCADTGRFAEAKEMYHDMLRHNPNSADAVSSLGLIYEKEKRWEEALGMWRTLGQGMQEGSYHWYEARYRSARCLGMLGRQKQGCDILTTTEVLHPSLRDDEYKQLFLLLQKELCGKP